MDARRRFLERVMLLGGAGLAPAAPATPAPAGGAVFDVSRYGAARDGSRAATEPVQQAIDACAAAGGGTVYFPPGRYVSGTLTLKSRVTLYLKAGAVLAGSRTLADYPSRVPRLRSYTDNYTERSLLYAEDAENIAIHGHGAIDGQGAAFRGEYKVRPFLIRLIGCRDVSIRDVTMRDAAMWALHLLACDDVAIDGLAIHRRVNPNNDGNDVDSCRRVRISNAEISTIDDAIVLKSCTDRACRDILVTNCALSTDCSALKLGTESNGGFENIVFGNCSIYGTRIAGIALLSVDGGRLDGVTISNIAMRNTAVPIFLRLGDRARPFAAGMPRPGAGTLANVRISGVEASGASAAGCLLTGIPDHALENVTLEGIRIAFAGGGYAAAAAREVPELPEAYPSQSNFGAMMPAYGLFCRHARNLALRDLDFRTAKPDARPGLVCEDVEGLALSGAALPLVLRDVRDAMVTGCRTREFARVEGARTANVNFTGNDLSRARVNAGAGVPPAALYLDANRT
jgi:hypothetical protein